MTGRTDPAREIRAITPSNDTDLTGCRQFFTTDGGNIAVKTTQGASAVTAVTIENVPVGMQIPLEITRIMATNTVATKIYGLF